MKITLMDGGIETRIIYEFKHSIGDFESFRLLRDARAISPPRTACRTTGSCRARVRGLKANASPLPPEELDKLGHLAATDSETWARAELS